MTVGSVALPYRLGVGMMVFNRQGCVWVGRRRDRDRIMMPDESNRLAQDPLLGGSFPGQMPRDTFLWQMPQGGIDQHEDPLQAMSRELYEEIGLKSDHVIVVAESAGWLTYDLPHELQSQIWGGIYRGQKQKWFALYFGGDDRLIDLNVDRAEFDAWQWVSPQLLPELIVSFKQKLYQTLVAEFLPAITKFLSDSGTKQPTHR